MWSLHWLRKCQVKQDRICNNQGAVCFVSSSVQAWQDLKDLVLTDCGRGRPQLCRDSGGCVSRGLQLCAILGSSFAVEAFWFCSCYCLGTWCHYAAQSGPNLRVLLCPPRWWDYRHVCTTMPSFLRVSGLSHSERVLLGKIKRARMWFETGYFISQWAVESAVSLVKRLASMFFNPICSIRASAAPPPPAPENSSVNRCAFSFF